MAAFCHAKKADGGNTMAESKTEKQKVQEITEKLEQGIKELLKARSTRLI